MLAKRGFSQSPLCLGRQLVSGLEQKFVQSVPRNTKKLEKIS